MARLSTHVLDTSRGLPARGVALELYAKNTLLRSTFTNADGRTGEPLLSGDRIEPGIYQLHFHAGDYFRTTGVTLPDPPFLDVVVIQFGIADPTANYHVPLLLSPYGYSTYRGS
jgi:5-hydroxyisourate hydrolase